jgi:hypothetical protein
MEDVFVSLVAAYDESHPALSHAAASEVKR